jgi:hypothetical protein
MRRDEFQQRSRLMTRVVAVVRESEFYSYLSGARLAWGNESTGPTGELRSSDEVEVKSEPGELFIDEQDGFIQTNRRLPLCPYGVRKCAFKQSSAH